MVERIERGRLESGKHIGGERNKGGKTGWQTSEERMGNTSTLEIRGTDNTSLARVMYWSGGAGACM